MSRRTLSLLVLGVCCSVVFACGEGDRAPTLQRAPASSVEVAEGPPIEGEPVEAAEEAVLPSAARLAPVFRTSGAFGAAPAKVVVVFARPVASEEAVGGKVPQGTHLEVEPEVPGTLRLAAPDVLEWTPNEPLAPETEYTLRLRSVETEAGVLRPEDPEAWTYRFETPPFRLLRAVPVSHSGSTGVQVVQLVFTGPVKIASVRDRVWIEVVKRVLSSALNPRDLTVRPGPEPHIVQVVPKAPLGRGVEALVVHAKAGIESAAGEGESSEGSWRLELSKGRGVEVRAVTVGESSSGHFVEVVCHDPAAGGRRSYYDPVQDRYFWDLSQRCLPTTESAKAAIHFVPAVDFSVVPSSGGFRLFGPFTRGAYTMWIDPGLTTEDGGHLAAALSRQLVVPARSPSLRLTTRGRYLPRRAWKSLAVEHVNVDAITVEVRRVRPENLVFWMSNDEDERLDARSSDLVARRRFPVSGRPDVSTLSLLDVGSLVPASTRGLLEISLRAGKAQATARVLLTDLLLVAKRSGPAAPGGTEPAATESAGTESAGAEAPKAPRLPEEIRVWALDLESLAPRSGVEVRAVRRSGTVLGRCTTGADGGCVLSPKAPDADPEPPFALLATHGEDQSYLKFDDVAVEVQEALVSGPPYRSRSPYEGSLFTDRGVYRPGETAHLVGLVRQGDHRAPEAGMPVKLVVEDPRGNTLRASTLKTNPAGMVADDLTLASFATTGRYRASLRVAEREVASRTFQVEEFVPERMKVEVRPDKTDLLQDEAAFVTVAAKYLFGGVPKDHRVELSCELTPLPFTPPEAADLVFGVWREEERPRSIHLGTRTETLDDAGKVRLSCPEARSQGLTGTGRLVLAASVFEAGSGRTTVGRASITVHPERFYLGLAAPREAVAAGDELPVRGRVVDWKGKPVDTEGSLTLELYRFEEEWGEYYDEEEGETVWRSYRRPVLLSSETVSVTGGRFEHTFSVTEDAAGYLVRARMGRARTDLEVEGSRRGYWYGWGYGEGEQDRTPKPARATWLALDAPERVRIGAPFEVRMRAPYAGRMLLTVETDRVIESVWQDVEAGEVVWPVTVEDFVPNVYVTALLLKDPKLESKEAFLPDRAFGVRSVSLEPEAFTREVRLEVPKEVRSRATLRVVLDLGKVPEGTYAAVAAVDEGILSLTGFESPDPVRDLFGRRALGVGTFETAGWSIPVTVGSPSASRGGDGAPGETLGRVQPIRPVALWSGLRKVPESGRLELSFDLPTYRGALRVMAVTADPERIGRAEAKVVVRDPLVVQTTLPRFLSQGDRFQIPVFVTNLSGKKREVEVSLSAEVEPVPGLVPRDGSPPPLRITGQPVRTLQIEDGASGIVAFEAVAQAATGAAKVVVKVRSGRLESGDEAVVPFLPTGPRVRRSQKIALRAGTTDLRPYLSGWEPLTETTTFWVTRNPYGEALRHLGYLIRYPYGCVEQTTSGTRALLYAKDLVGSVEPTLVATKPVDDMIVSGIERILAMQTPAGGFGYWPGAVEPTPWATAYATHLLIEASAAGYPVAPERIDAALSWLDAEVEGSGKAPTPGAAAEDAYLYYVLAYGKHPKKARIGA
ncbi:MAG: hypothetical protein D6729_01060, partial [Deltaproteobacteria bacterium]